MLWLNTCAYSYYTVDSERMIKLFYLYHLNHTDHAHSVLYNLKCLWFCWHLLSGLKNIRTDHKPINLMPDEVKTAHKKKFKVVKSGFFFTEKITFNFTSWRLPPWVLQWRGQYRPLRGRFASAAWSHPNHTKTNVKLIIIVTYFSIDNLIYYKN
jgi:hypothetical protein